MQAVSPSAFEDERRVGRLSDVEQGNMRAIPRMAEMPQSWLAKPNETCAKRRRTAPLRVSGPPCDRVIASARPPSFAAVDGAQPKARREDGHAVLFADAAQVPVSSRFGHIGRVRKRVRAGSFRHRTSCARPWIGWALVGDRSCRTVSNAGRGAGKESGFKAPCEEGRAKLWLPERFTPGKGLGADSIDKRGHG